MPEQAKCRSCGAPIIWAKTEAGKPMPLDIQPSPSGTFTIRHADGRAWRGNLHEELQAIHKSKIKDLGPWYTSHFATCPNANQHRKPKESKDAHTPPS